MSAHLSSAYPTTEEGCQFLSAGTPSYIHETCQYVTKDKVLQLGFSFTKISSCCFMCVCLAVKEGNLQREFRSVLLRKPLGTGAHLVSPTSTCALEGEKKDFKEEKKNSDK